MDAGLLSGFHLDRKTGKHRLISSEKSYCASLDTSMVLIGI